MIRQRIKPKSIMLTVEVSNLEVTRVCLELTLDRLFLVLTDTVQVFGAVNFHEFVFLIPTVAIDWSERHIIKIKWFTIRTLNLLFFRLFFLRLSLLCNLLLKLYRLIQDWL